MYFKIICFVLLLAVVASRPIKSSKGLKRFLHQYGYSKKEDLNPVELEEAIGKLQEFFKLKKTDDLTPFVEGSRCGIKDIADQSGPLAYTLGPKWTSKNLRYRVINFPSLGGIPQTNVRAIVDRSFQKWENVVKSGFTINPINGTQTPHFNLRFASYNHSDSSPFDGPGKVLAHAFFPQSGQIHFDNSETWSEGFDKTKGYNLEWVAIHEIGHALGLGHSTVTSAIMYPYYSAVYPNSLQPDDIAGINALYP